MSDGQEQCVHIKDNGERCGIFWGLSDEGLCLVHDPEREEEAQAARSDGGRTTAKRRRKRPKIRDADLPPLESHAAAETWTDEIGRAVATGRMGAAEANAALRAVKEWREAHDAGRVSDRLEALMDALSEWRKTGDPEPVLELVEGSA